MAHEQETQQLTTAAQQLVNSLEPQPLRQLIGGNVFTNLIRRILSEVSADELLQFLPEETISTLLAMVLWAAVEKYPWLKKVSYGTAVKLVKRYEEQ